MRPSSIIALVVVVTVGCGKPAVSSAPEPVNTPAQQAQVPPATPVPPITPPGPVEPKPAEPKSPVATPHPLSGKVSTVDLTPYKIRAVIDLPEGATLRPSQRGVSLHIEYGKAETIGVHTLRQFDLQISRAVGNFTLDEVKKIDRSLADKLIVHAETVDRYFFQEGTDGIGKYTMGRAFTTGDQLYYVHFSCAELGNELTKEKIQPLWKAIESLRQTEQQQKAEAVRAATFKKLLRKGEDPESFLDRPFFYGFDDDLVVSLKYEIINAKSIQILKDIPDLHTVRLVGFEKFDKKLFQDILDLQTVRAVWLDGDWVTDEVLALVASNSRITDVTLVRADVTDKGFAKLEQLPKLRMVELQFCEKVTPTATKSLRAKFPKLVFTNDQ